MLKALFAAATVVLVVMSVLATGRHAAAAPDTLMARWSVLELAGKPAAPAGDITFDSDSVSGAASCNYFRGSAEFGAGETLTIIVGATTRRACSGIAAEHETAFLKAMAATRSYQIEGDELRLMGDGGAVVAKLTRSADAALEGPRHKIVSYFKDGGLYSVTPGTNPKLTLKDGAISGFTGCRNFTARYARTGDALAIADIAADAAPAECPETTKDQDGAILAALPKARTFDANRNLVRLLEAADGNAVLWITPDTW